jgi:hypothetical protein
MSFHASPRFFDNDEISALALIYEQSCAELGIAPYDRLDVRRDSVAHVVMMMALCGERQPHVIKRRALMRLRHAA